MGQVTILNGTNVPINSCISAGFNYSWVNKLPPRQFYAHNGAAGVFTLNTNYWLGPSSEFSNNAASIFLWTANMVVAVVGVVLIPFTDGASALAVTSAISSSVGAIIQAISVAGNEFTNAPYEWHNIQAIHDRKFIAEGNIDIRQNSDGTITYVNPADIKLRELQDSEYRQLISKKDGYVEYLSNGDTAPIGDQYQTRDNLFAARVLGTDLLIRPHASASTKDTADWEIEDDNTADGALLQLWARGGDRHARWRIDYVKTLDHDLFTIKNSSLQSYATASSKNDSVVSGSSNAVDAALFYVIKTGTTGTSFAFQTHNGEQIIIPENGNLGNSTKLKLAKKYNPHPYQGRWDLITPASN
jgi:hypothetical protein